MLIVLHVLSSRIGASNLSLRALSKTILFSWKATFLAQMPNLVSDLAEVTCLFYSKTPVKEEENTEIEDSILTFCGRGVLTQRSGICCSMGYLPILYEYSDLQQQSKSYVQIHLVKLRGNAVQKFNSNWSYIHIWTYEIQFVNNLEMVLRRKISVPLLDTFPAL